jgi:two-component system, OmpR family, sensor histidine kinase TctE
VADAAHQLRTPIAGLLAQLESGGAAERSPALLTTTRRLARLVGQLLALSRAEPGVIPERQAFDLAALIRDAANEWLPQAFRCGTELRFDLATTPIVGAPHAWREMLANLVDNAIRYGKPQGTVAICCRDEDGEALVQVDDDGPGIDAAERERVFERFYRSAGTASEGCGLGLAIVRALALQQGAKVSLGGTPSRVGLRVELRCVSATACESDAQDRGATTR